MEKLEGKYFENTIAALKQAKNEENITMRSEFRAELRNALEAQALGMPETTGFDWADFILRFKYVMAGVPVLAVMTLVAASVYNWQVKLPTQQIVPVSNNNTDQQTQLRTEDTSFTQDLQTNLVNQQPALVTFSADSVMPPLEVLLEARQRLIKGEVFEIDQLPEITQNQTSLPDLSVQMKVQTPAIETYSFLPATSNTEINSNRASDASLADISMPRFIFNGTRVEFGTINVPQTNEVRTNDQLRTENNARVEVSGQIESQPIQQNLQDNAIQAPLNQETQVNLVPVVETQPLSIESNLIVPEATETKMNLEQPDLKLESNAILTEGKGTLIEDSYIDPVEEKTLDNNVDLKLQSNSMMILPTYLEDSRIYFEGEERSEVLIAVKRGLYAKNGSLSSDYYVKVKRLDNGNYKAVLLEYGQIQKILIMGYRGGELTVITELDY
jgi:hypothetical protein